MTTQLSAHSVAVSTSEPMLPYWAEIVKIKPEAPGILTYWMRFLDEDLRKRYSFKPGQFNMLSVPGFGEAAISISSDPEKNELIAHTIRMVGNVTQAIGRLKVGDVIGVRGPFGTYWPLEEHKGKDIVITAGGIGLPPIRPAIYYMMHHRQDYGRIIILYGARTPRDLQFIDEHEEWQKAGLELMVTVDVGDETWTGPVGVVPILFYHLRVNPQNSVIFTCGPEIMLRFVVYEALARRISEKSIYVSMERNMKCGMGFCGHCQIGPYFVCKDGPVFRFDMLQPYYNVEEL